MKLFLVFSINFFACVTTELLEDGREAVKPEYLSSLLNDKNYEEFNRLMRIDIPHLSRPRDENDKSDPRYNIELEHGDMLMTPEQKKRFQEVEARNSINYDKHPTYKWPNGILPYAVKEDDYTPAELKIIYDGFAKCNKDFNGCVTLMHYNEYTRRFNKEPVDYVMVFSGNGCYSYLGKVGGQQAMSLMRKGCLHPGTMCHEIMHAYGFTHEHCREDRDNWIIMNWNNIKKGWETQFSLAQYDTFVLHKCFDFCSTMMYPQYHPDLCEPGKTAYDIKQPDSVNCTHVIGYAQELSKGDIEKVCKAYKK